MSKSKLTYREKRIWLPVLKPIIDNLLAGTCPFYMLNYHFGLNTSMIKQNYAAVVEIKVEDFRPPLPDSTRSYSCTLLMGRPVIKIFLSEVEKDIAQTNSLPGASQEQIESMVRTSILTGFLHETDHLALGLVPKSDFGEWIRFSEMLKHEVQTNARTCEHVILPLFEQCGQSLGPSEFSRYQAWKNCGQDVASPLWRKFVEDMYTYKKGEIPSQ